MGHIHLLPSETSRLIAAGEVIDRPASALRELLDNAIDAKATDIQVRIEKGGIDLIQVVDNGTGMSREDLELSIAEHATSKIETADDLLSVQTLGFRGEALASIAAVAELEIITRVADSPVGWQLTKPAGKSGSDQNAVLLSSDYSGSARGYNGKSPVKPIAASVGTTVHVRSLFAQYPARRQFLKRPMSEALLCHSVFVERALAFPEISFSWSSGETKEHYPASSLEQRLCLLYPEIPSSLVFRFDSEFCNGSFSLLFTDPSFHRKDRRYLQIFVNKRKVPEWGFSSILEYAFSSYLPGGMKPCAFLFASIPPALADFNIHPAKREVRIKNIEAFKSALYASVQPQLLKTFGAGPTNMAGVLSMSTYDWSASDATFKGKAFSEGSSERSPDYWKTDHGTPAYVEALTRAARNSEFDGARDNPSQPAGSYPTEGVDNVASSFRYIGRAFGPFLLFERNNTLYILDQHAAHERLLYDELKAASHPAQALLVPYVFDFPSEESNRRFLENRTDLERMGFRFELTQGSCVINEVPALLGEARAVASLQSLFFAESSESEEVFGSAGTLADSVPSCIADAGGAFRGAASAKPKATDLFASLACKAAIKDGDILDQASAIDLIARALRLPFPRCPHGRPIWVVLDKDTLYKMVGRLVE